ncbi:hypothetical protein GH733_019600 [Mirounga leonina]|nr:hypothetical protein GH733_019600 [Mirounga leonina]
MACLRKLQEALDGEPKRGVKPGKTLRALILDIKQALLAKRKMFEVNAKALVKTTNEKIEHVWNIQQEQRQNLHLKYSQQFLTLYRAWDTDMRKAREQEEKLASMQDLEKAHEHLLTDEQSEVREDMTKLQNKIMMEAVSGVYLILRTKEGCGHWGILLAKLYVTIT